MISTKPVHISVLFSWDLIIYINTIFLGGCGWVESSWVVGCCFRWLLRRMSEQNNERDSFNEYKFSIFYIQFTPFARLLQLYVCFFLFDLQTSSFNFFQRLYTTNNIYRIVYGIGKYVQNKKHRDPVLISVKFHYYFHSASFSSLETQNNYYYRRYVHIIVFSRFTADFIQPEFLIKV